MNEEQMQKRLKRMVRFVIFIGILLLVTGLLFAGFLLRTMKHAALNQMYVETKEYNKRLYDQIDADYQTINTFASVIGEGDLTSKEEFPEMLDEANYQNDFLTMIYLDGSKTGVAATLERGVTENIPLSDMQAEVQDVLVCALEGEEKISQLFRGSFSNEAVFVYGTPVYKGDTIVGALAASDKVEIFNDILDGQGVLGGYGYMNMINMDGDYIVHSEKDKIGRDLDNVFSEPYFNESEAKQAKKELQQKGKLEFSFSYGGDHYEAIIEPVGINNWCLLSISDVHTSSREVYLIVRIIGGIFGGILILVLFLLFYVCRVMRKNVRELRNIAYHDPLTGAYNFVGFRKKVEERLQTDAEYSIISLNVHQFKFINEIFGKEQGDRILRRIGESILEHAGEGDIICRESADIFYLFTNETDMEKIYTRFQHVMQDVTQTVDEGNGDYEVLMYCGADICRKENGVCSLDEMMTHVKVALERAKETHQSNLRFFDKQLHRKEVMDNFVETHMNQALKDGEFRLYLQPKTELATGEVTGAEALVRWIKEDGEMIYPDQFIPLFEKNGFCIQLDLYMADAVCRQILEWRQKGLDPVSVSINQSKRAIFEKDYIMKLTEILDKYDIPPQLITLEILEGLALENAEDVNRKMQELQKRGFRVSLDDFGSEYSSLNTFSKVRIDELKLDRWFLQDIASGRNSKVRLILEEIIAIARKLHISTVVEGVETEEDHRLICDLKCDYGQGYYYCRPVSAEVFTDRYLKAKKSIKGKEQIQ